MLRCNDAQATKRHVPLRLDQHANGTGTLRHMTVVWRLAVRVIVMILWLLVANFSHAGTTCTPTNANKTLNAGSITIPANAPSGTTVSTLAPVTFEMQCRFTNNNPLVTSSIASIQLQLSAPLAPGFTDVYQTGIPGLGIRYAVNASQCDATNLVISNSKLRFGCPVAGPLGGPDMPTPVAVTSSFVVFGPVQGGAHTISSVPVLAMYYDVSDVPKLWPQAPVYSGSATGSLMSATCSVQTEALAVTLPTPAVRAFASGIGAVAGRQAFNLSFACSSGAQVSIVITDAVDPSNRSNVLKLAPDSTAKGIGVQVLKDKGTPVDFGPDAVGQSVANQWLIGASPNGLLVLPLSAQYIRTGNVEPGSVRALATFTMSYQ